MNKFDRQDLPTSACDAKLKALLAKANEQLIYGKFQSAKGIVIEALAIVLANQAVDKVINARHSAKEALLEGLNFVVQYRRKDSGAAWTSMAAFDREGPANRYAAKCKENEPWEYRVIAIEEEL